MQEPRGQLSSVATIALLLGGLVLLVLGMELGVVVRGTLLGESREVARAAFALDPLAAGVVQLLAMGTTLFVGTELAFVDASGPRMPRTAAWGLRRVPPSALGLAALGGVGLHFALVAAMALLSRAVPALALDDEAATRIAELTRIDGVLRALTVPTTIVVIAAGTEELLFRGLLLGALRPRWGRGGAWVLTSLLFGLFHVEPFAAVYATIAGLALGALALRAGSILPCFAMHGAFNAVPLLLPEALIPIPGLNTGESDALLPWPLALGGAVVFAVASLALHRILPPPPAEPDAQREG